VNEADGKCRMWEEESKSGCIKTRLPTDSLVGIRRPDDLLTTFIMFLEKDFIKSMLL
jgi:hypothetical protein